MRATKRCAASRTRGVSCEGHRQIVEDQHDQPAALAAGFGRGGQRVHRHAIVLDADVEILRRQVGHGLLVVVHRDEVDPKERTRSPSAWRLDGDGAAIAPNTASASSRRVIRCSVDPDASPCTHLRPSRVRSTVTSSSGLPRAPGSIRPTAGAARRPRRRAPAPAKRREYLRGYIAWLWPHRFAIVAFFAIALVAAGLEMLEPLFMRFIIDRVLLNTALDIPTRMSRLHLDRRGVRRGDPAVERPAASSAITASGCSTCG